MSAFVTGEHVLISREGCDYIARVYGRPLTGTRYSSGIVATVIMSDSTSIVLYFIANGTSHELKITTEEATKYLKKLLDVESSLALSWKTPAFKVGKYVEFTPAGIDYIKRRFATITGITDEPPEALFEKGLGGYVNKISLDSIEVIVNFIRLNINGFYPPDPAYVEFPYLDADKYIIYDPWNTVNQATGGLMLESV
jgi:hypothetical protein